MLLGIFEKLKNAIDGKGIREKVLYAVLTSLVLAGMFFFFSSTTAALRDEPIELAAGFLDDAVKILKNLTNRVMPGENKEVAQIDGEAIRKKNSGGAEESISDFERFFLNMNTRGVFKQGFESRVDSKFSANVDIRGLLTGTNIDLATGTIIASNIIYDVVAGDGIAVSGGQTPTVSSLYWTQDGNTILTKNPALSLQI